MHTLRTVGPMLLQHFCEYCSITSCNLINKQQVQHDSLVYTIHYNNIIIIISFTSHMCCYLYTMINSYKL